MDLDAPRILVVEDEGIVAMDLGARLRGLGYTVVGVAMTGEEAIRLTADQQPNLVLMDITLRGNMDGIEAASQISNTHHVPVVYLTAHSDAGTLDRAKATGPYGYILKPYTESDLRATIEVALYKYAADEQVRAMREELGRSEKLAALGRLIAAISHEINNPLSTILINLFLAQQALARDVVDPATVTKHLEVARAEATHIGDIVHRCQDYNTLVTQVTKRCGEHATDVGSVLGDVVAESEQLLGAQGINVTVDGIDDLPNAKLPADQIEQVFRALVRNARKAMPKGGTLSIQTWLERERGMLDIAFQDTGEPLPTTALARVFEPFFVAYPACEVYASDLGLPISYQIVKAHGGTIEVSPQAGSGTRYTVQLPVAEPLNEN